jgi:hypothetical protein
LLFREGAILKDSEEKANGISLGMSRQETTFSVAVRFFDKMFAKPDMKRFHFSLSA